MSFVGCRLKVELIDVEHFAVDSSNLAGNRCLFFGHLFGKGNYYSAGALTIELSILDELDGSAVRAEEFHAGDEFKVFTVNGELLSTADYFFFFLGEAFDNSFSHCQLNRGFGLVIICLDDKFTGGNTCRNYHAKHIVRHFFEIGNGFLFGEYHRRHIIEAGAVDGYLQAGNDLGGEDSLDSQTKLFRSVDIFREAGCNCKTHQSD